MSSVSKTLKKLKMRQSFVWIMSVKHKGGADPRVLFWVLKKVLFHESAQKSTQKSAQKSTLGQ